MGDLREDCEDMELISPVFEEFFRRLPEVVEPDLSLREKSPILSMVDVVVGCTTPVRLPLSRMSIRDPVTSVSGGEAKPGDRRPSAGRGTAHRWFQGSFSGCEVIN